MDVRLGDDVGKEGMVVIAVCLVLLVIAVLKIESCSVECCGGINTTQGISSIKMEDEEGFFV